MAHFIDFDSFCLAEPALDAGHFYASIVDSGMKWIPEASIQDPVSRQADLNRFDSIGATFLSAYGSQARVSTPRLQLWMALDYCRDALQLWTKPKRGGVKAVLSIREFHLRRMGLVVLLGLMEFQLDWLELWVE